MQPVWYILCITHQLRSTKLLRVSLLLIIAAAAGPKNTVLPSSCKQIHGHGTSWNRPDILRVLNTPNLAAFQCLKIFNVNNNIWSCPHNYQQSPCCLHFPDPPTDLHVISLWHHLDFLDPLQCLGWKCLVVSLKWSHHLLHSSLWTVTSGKGHYPHHFL